MHNKTKKQRSLDEVDALGCGGGGRVRRGGGEVGATDQAADQRLDSLGNEERRDAPLAHHIRPVEKAKPRAYEVGGGREASCQCAFAI